MSKKRRLESLFNNQQLSIERYTPSRKKQRTHYDQSHNINFKHSHSSQNVSQIDVNIMDILNKLQLEPEIYKFKQFIVTEEFDYQLIVDDMKGEENESDILPIIGHELYNKIKSIIFKNLNHQQTDSTANKKEACINTMALFNGYDDRIIACNGDCGSEFSKMIDCCVHQKELNQIKDIKKTIKSAFWSHGDPLRALLIFFMEQKGMYQETEFHQEIYHKLIDKNCFIRGKQWVNKIKSLLSLSCIDHIDVLENMANHSCEIKNNRSLSQEIDIFYNKDTSKLQQELSFIDSYLNLSKFKNIRDELLKQKQEIEYKMASFPLKSLNTTECEDKINKIRRTDQFKIMQSKGLELSNQEILSVILYCDYDVFGNKMRESHRVKNINSCEWRKLFGFLHSAIYKIHKAFHYKNDGFWNKYIKQKIKHRLYRGLYDVSLGSNCKYNLSLKTITSFSESFDVAKTFASTKGMILAINDAFQSIYDGSLYSADVSWISMYKKEKEWIVLPTEFTSILKITANEKIGEYFGKTEINNNQYIEIYEANIKYDCDMIKCKWLKRILIMLYHYNKKHKISNNDNIVANFIKTKENGYENLLNDCMHIQHAHYDNIMHDDNNLCVDIMNNMSQYGIDQDVLRDLKQFLKAIDIINAEKTDKGMFDPSYYHQHCSSDARCKQLQRENEELKRQKEILLQQLHNMDIITTTTLTGNTITLNLEPNTYYDPSEPILLWVPVM